MAQSKRPNRTWYLLVGFLVVAALVAFLVSRRPFGRTLDHVIRVSALLGYLGVFAAAVTSAYLREMLRIFGRPFLTVHHYLAVTALVLLMVHPISAAVRSQSLALFVPVLSSPREFLRWGGRPAWYLLLIASAAALWRRTAGDAWRSLHMLTYLAFWLATAHAILLGTDVQGPFIRGLAVVLALVMAGVLVRRRQQAAARKKKTAA
ncbi:MAG: hypothetical protein ACOYEW_14745 [Anaerolineae bacterium]